MGAEDIDETVKASENDSFARESEAPVRVDQQEAVQHAPLSVNSSVIFDSVYRIDSQRSADPFFLREAEEELTDDDFGIHDNESGS